MLHVNKDSHSWPDWHCPNHEVPLQEEGSYLRCPEGELYPVRNGIPRFVKDSEYAESFGLQWKKYRLTQLDSYTKTNISLDRIRRCFGTELWAGIAGRNVLECGCGSGRFTEVLLAAGAVITSVDLSEAVDANKENNGHHSHLRLAQASIARPPFPREQFDIVVCLGVLQHTPDPDATVKRLFDMVRPGGALVVDCYSPNAMRYTTLKPLYRYFIRQLTPQRRYKICKNLVDMFWPIHKLTRTSALLQSVLSRFSPVLCYWQLYPELNEQQQKEWALLDTHDSLTDHYKHTRSRGQLEALLQRVGAERIACSPGGIGVEARAYKPHPDSD